MDIGSYIADLLQNQDEVGLPGLGTFTKSRLSASYDRESNNFIPPGYQIIFNNTPVSNNSLVEYISIQKNLSHSSSEYFVNKFTSSIFNQLQTSGFAEINPLGIIRHQDGSFTFKAANNTGIAGKFYGLKPVKERKEEFAPPEVENPNKGIVSEQKEEIFEDELAVEENKGNVLKMVIIGSIMLLFIMAGLLYVFNPAVKKLAWKLFSPAVSTEPLRNHDTINSNTPIVIADSTIAETTAISGDSSTADSSALTQKSITTVPDSLIEIQPTYEIIGAGFNRRSEAENYIKDLASKGIEARIIENMPGKIIKISLGSFTDESAAHAELAKIQKNINKEAWIARVKPQKKP